jgi:hypothetical protein
LQDFERRTADSEDKDAVSSHTPFRAIHLCLP